MSKFPYEEPDRGWGGDRRRGASHGRRDTLPRNTVSQCRIRPVPVVDGGYDPGGAYWGHDPRENPLFCVWSDSSVAYIWAPSIVAAKAKFPNAVWVEESGPEESDLEEMLQGFLGGALYATTDESTEAGGGPLDENYTTDDFDPKTVARLREVVAKFARENGKALAASLGYKDPSASRICDWHKAGWDLWLTIAETGAGFGDGDWPEEYDDALYEAAQNYDRIYLYVGANGVIGD